MLTNFIHFLYIPIFVGATTRRKGEIIGNVEESFPASALTSPSIFVSLLFYYSMLTIKGTKGAKLVLGIPNNNVRMQYYESLLR